MLRALGAGAMAWLIALCLPAVFLRAPRAARETVRSAVCADGGSDAAAELEVELDGRRVTMPLSEFLEGVVAGEMPASYPEEALAAQAIAARTMVYRRLSDDVTHATGAPVCTDPAHCMAFSPPDADGRTAVARAVARTDGIVAVYGGEPIIAAFHAVSGGMTEASADVWGGDMPYLTNVYSPGEESAAGFCTEKTFSAREFAARIRSAYSVYSSNGLVMNAARPNRKAWTSARKYSCVSRQRSACASAVERPKASSKPSARIFS